MAFLDNISNNARTITQQGLSALADTPGIKSQTTNPGPGPKTLEFPINLGDLKRPIVRFACTPSESNLPITSISLPIPGNLAFTDGSTYTTIDMGTVAAISEITQSFEGGGARAAAEETKNQLFSGGAIGASIIAARTLGADKTAQTLEFSSKQVVNPRTNTAFAGNTLRNFQFDFKMIGKSPAEVRQIDQIQNQFRNNMYASELGGQKTMLKYPSLWTITFLDPTNGYNEMEFIPKIFTCYLTGFTTTINSSANTYRKDMSPYEIDVSCQFQESKVLTRNELEDLELNSNRENSDNAYIQEKEQELINTQNRLAEEYAAKQAELAEQQNNTD